MKQVIIAFTSVFLSSVCIAQNQKDLIQETASVNSIEKLEEFNNYLQNNQQQLVFQENKGQVHDQNHQSHPEVLFSGQTNGMVFHLKNKGISYQLNRVDSYKEVKDERTVEIRQEIDKTTIYRIDINWLNTNSNTLVKKENATEGFNNYYLEHCPNGALNVFSYENITYQNIYNGIDLKWYSKEGTLKYDYLVAAEADYRQIAFEIKGAESILINAKGELEIKTPLGTIIEESPYVIQEGKELKSQWVINNNIIHFNIENIDASKPFIIDPAIRQWGTYYGGVGTEFGYSCATTELGTTYMTGYTNSLTSTNIITIGSHQASFGGDDDAFLVKFNSSGVRQWGTYYGGVGEDVGRGCDIDGSGNVYLTGYTYTPTSTSIMTLSSHQNTYGGGSNDAFLVKFNSSGVRQWGTYYGGIGDDRGYSCAVDGFGNVFITGITSTPTSTSIITLSAHQGVFGGNNDAFLVKFNSAGVRQWGTYYGGSEADMGMNCKTDELGNVYMVGNTSTNSGTSIASGGHQNIFGGGTDGFLVKFNSAGIRQWGTYYGGTGFEEGNSCDVDAAENVYLTGHTQTNTGTSIATPGSHQSVSGDGGEAYLVKFNSAGVRQWGTYYGGVQFERGDFCRVDAVGNVYLAGSTSSTTNIATVGSYQSAYGGLADGFLTKFNSAGIREWGTYYGGTGSDYAYSCAVDNSGNIYLAGNTTSNSGTSIASVGSHQGTFGGSFDAFLVKFSQCTHTSATDIETACDSFTWINGITYTSSTSLPTYTLTNASGCDSIITLNLTIHYSNTGTDIQTACDSYTWINGITYTSSTSIPTFTLTNGADCDSVVTLNLTVSYTTTVTDVQTACDSFTWINGVTYTASNSTAMHVLTNEAGCDSIVILDLTINGVSDLTTSLSGTTIIANNTSATYQWLDCNTSFNAISGETLQNFTPLSNGSYAVQLTQNGCIDTSTCVVVTTVGVEENTFTENFTIYPNPNNGQFIIELAENSLVEITDILGKQVFKSNLQKGGNQVNLSHIETGVYFVTIITGGKQVSVKIVKE